MRDAVARAVTGANILIMAAAVSDFRSEQTSARKIKKDQGQEYLDLRLVRNPDILAEIGRPGLTKIGFAAETDDLLENARRKLVSKDLAMIVANDAASTIVSRESTATFIFADRDPVELPRMRKEALAKEIVRAAATLLAPPASDS